MGTWEAKTSCSEEPEMITDRDRITELKRVAGRGAGVYR